MKNKVIDNSMFPRKIVVRVQRVPILSVSYRMGNRLMLELDCGHVVALKRESYPAVVPCMKCYQSENE